MNQVHIIGRLTKDPDLRTTATGLSVCSFTVAVNRRQSAQQRQSGQQADADFFNVSAWRERGETCAKYLSKGKMVSVTGPVSVKTYQTQNGEFRADLVVTADDVEFLSPKESNTAPRETPQNNPVPEGYTQTQVEGLPF